MKLDESILNQFDLNPQVEREPVNVMQISELLDFLKESSERLIKKSKLFFTSEDADIQLDCMDVVATRLNDFAKAFMDMVIFIRKEEGSYNGHSSSLRYCVTGYDTIFIEQTDGEKKFLSELLLRNEITHDYFNREIHQQKLINMMQNCMDGSLDVYEHLKEYCLCHKFLEKFINRGR